MKTLIPLLAAGSVILYSPAHAEDSTSATESNDRAITDLCATYAREDDISTKAMGAYIQECIDNLSNLSTSMQENQEVIADAAREPDTATPSGQSNNTPEQMVQNELVNTPDPTAEQLNTTK